MQSLLHVTPGTPNNHLKKKWMFGETTIFYKKSLGIIQLKQAFINGWLWGSRH